MIAPSRLLLSNIFSLCLGRSFRLISHAPSLLTCSSSKTRSTFISSNIKHSTAQVHTLPPRARVELHTTSSPRADLSQLRAQLATNRSVREQIRGVPSHLLSAHRLLHLHCQASLPSAFGSPVQ